MKCLLIAKAEKPHNTVEQLILPATKVIMNTMLGTKETKCINLISLLNDVIKNRIHQVI